MAKLVFIGAALGGSQIDTILAAGTFSAGETVSVQVGNKKVTYTVLAGDTPTLVATGLTALLTASTAPEVKEVTWTSSGATITATSTAGIPVTLVASETAAAGTFVLTAGQAATGPNFWDDALNWSTGAVPVNTDEVYIDEDFYSVTFGLPDAGDALTLNKFAMKRGQVGLPDRNTGGYNEYRPTRAVFTCLDVQFGSGGVGPRLARVDLASGASVVGVFGSSTRQDFGAIDLLLNSASSTIAITAGQVAIAYSGDEVSTVGTIRVGGSGSCYVGAGCTVTTVSTSGSTTLEGTVTTCNVLGGITTRRGALTTLVMTSGQFIDLGVGTITTATIAGQYDRSKDVRPVTLTTATLNLGGDINDPFNAVTIGTFVKGANARIISAR